MVPSPGRALRPPQYRTSFVGRRQDLAALQDALSPGAVISLVGPGGVGKTRLASEAVSGLRACFLDLTSARAPSDAAQLVLQALGSRENLPEQDTVEHAAALLAEVPADVVVLDNLEQLEEAATFVQRLRATGPARSWLLTSRLPVGAGETQIPVIPLAAEGAVDLFLRVLPASAPSALHAQRDRLARLAGALDGLPLALELAAARAAVLSLDELEQRMRDPLRLLVDPARPEDKGSALWRSVSWSVELLPAEVRRVLARCSVFAAGFDTDAAEAIAGSGVHPSLQRLVQLFLLREEAGRYRPYEVVARFAERMLQQSGEEREAVLAHARWCREQRGAGEVWEVYLRVGAELELAQRRAEHPGAEPELRQLGQSLMVLCHPPLQVRLSRLEFIERAARMAPRLDDELTAVIFQRRGVALFDLGRLEEGEALIRQAADHARERGFAEPLVLCLCSLANGALQRESYDEVEALAQESLALARSAGLHQLERRFLLGPLNLPLLHQGRFVEVAERLARARTLATTASWSLSGLDAREALLLLEMGDWEGVEQRLQRLTGPTPLIPGVEVERRLATCKLALVREPRPAAKVNELARDLPLPVEREQFETLQILAELLEGRARPDSLWPSSAGRRGDIHSRMVLELAAVITGREPQALEDRRDPVMSALTDALALARLQLRGELAAEQALEALSQLRPWSWDLHFARRVLADLAHLQRALQVDPAGAWFEQGGVRTMVPPGLLRRLLLALASDGGTGRDVEALARAGWPGETLRKETAANRVRVALTKLRQLGLPVRFARGSGWTLR